MKKILKSFTWIFISTTILCGVACKKFVTVDLPPNTINNLTVYSTNANAIGVMTGVYSGISSAGLTSQSIPSLSLICGLSADEYTLYSTIGDPQLSYYKNSLNPLKIGNDFWSIFYGSRSIYQVNSAIEELSKVPQLDMAVQKQLMGEAKFMRAFFYFYLTSLYGDVPLTLTTDYKTNSLLAKSTQSQIYDQIISDLKDAQSLLNTNFPDITLLKSTTERVRPTKWVANALLARVYLYKGDWANAEAQASSVIDNSSQFRLEALSNVFLKNNSEAIWQIQPTLTGYNTQEAQTFVIPSTGPGGARPVYLSNYLLNSFEVNDQRRNVWVSSVIAGGSTYYFPYKYKISTLSQPVQEYETVFRLGEQYLIRAESRVQQNKLAEGKLDLDSIRIRAKLPAYNGIMSQSALLSAITHERQIELFSEFGHRWLDLKRTGTIDAVMGGPGNVAAAKGGTWNTNYKYYPIPTLELQKSVNVTQTPGY